MRVLIADDHALFRDGLRSLLEARGLEVVAEATDGRQAVDHALSAESAGARSATIGSPGPTG